MALVVIAACSSCTPSDGANGDVGKVGPIGAQGEPGPEGPAGPSGSEISPSEVLTKLSEVDGEGSGVDADTIDGRDATEFAEAGRRTIQLGNAQGELPDVAPDARGTSVRLPSDMKSGTNLELVVGFWMTGGTFPCELRLSALAQVLEEGSGDTLRLIGSEETIEVEAAVTYSTATLFWQADAKNVLVPDTWAWLGVERNTADSCTGELNLIGLASDYASR